jgi:hypothetical protein
MRLPAARLPRIRSFVSVPVVLSDGSLYGTFCAAGLTSDKELTVRDKALMEVLAHAASLVIEPGVVELATGDRVGAEALSRFPAEWGQAPDVCFAAAHSIGFGDRLELLAIERAAEHLATVTGYLAMNVSPAALVTPECSELLARLPVDLGAPRALGARPGAGLRRTAKHAGTAPATRHAAGDRRRRRRLLLVAAHRRHDTGRHQAGPEPGRRGHRRPGASHARPVPGGLRARIRRQLALRPPGARDRPRRLPAAGDPAD